MNTCALDAGYDLLQLLLFGHETREEQIVTLLSNPEVETESRVADNMGDDLHGLAGSDNHLETTLVLALKQFGRSLLGTRNIVFS